MSHTNMKLNFSADIMIKKKKKNHFLFSCSFLNRSLKESIFFSLSESGSRRGERQGRVHFDSKLEMIQ